MSHPTPGDEPTARPTPTSALATALSRRSVFRGALGAAAVVGLPGLLAACGSGSDSGSSSVDPSKATGEVSVGSNASDAVPKKALSDILAAYAKQSNGVTTTVNTVDHNTFQEQINNYLQGEPQDVFTWFSGYRMRFFADQGLAGDISDVWKKIDGMTDALKTASTSTDGKQYFVPFTTYPWAVYYRPSVFKAHGYTAPKTMTEFYALCAQMKKDGLTPIAFADKDGWPAMGTFDQLNLRINGYQFHVDLMAGKGSWTDQKVKTVFDEWRKVLEYSQTGSLGRTWQEAAQTLQKKQAGMYVLGMFVGQQFTAGADREDLDFFGFPEVDPAIGTDAIEAPIDGYMMAKKPKNEAGAKNLLTYLSTAAAQQVSVASDTTVIATSSKADTSSYTTLQKKAVTFIAAAKQISQFLDRDTRPDFASTVITPALQTFIGKPNDVDGLVNSIENQKKTIFT